MSDAYYVYVLRNPKGRFYVGQTRHLDQRLTQHNANPEEGETWPRKHGPWELAWSEPHPTRASAIRRERQIKSMKSARWIREHLLAEDPVC